MRTTMPVLLALCVVASAVYGAQAARDPSKLNVHLVPHSHDDAGWLKAFDEYYYGARQDIQIAGVREILTSVVQALEEDESRRFSWADMSFFIRWWSEQGAARRARVKRLVADGRLSFVNGGVVQHDEAGAHYVAMLDQTTHGHRFLNSTFGITPRVGWQIDPFGHSSTHASLMSALVGFEALFFGRADYQDMALRKAARAMEVVWRGSASWGAASDIFTHNYPSGNYGPPPGFNWEWALSFDPPIVDDRESPSYNVPGRVAAFLSSVDAWAAQMRYGGGSGGGTSGEGRGGGDAGDAGDAGDGGRDVLFMMGTDFTYADANVWYTNMDKLIYHVNRANASVNVFYSTPADYAAARRGAYGGPWPLKTDDFFPYADCPHCYWTGYFTSRPASKGYIRAATAFLQAARQLQLLSRLPPPPPPAAAAAPHGEEGGGRGYPSAGVGTARASTGALEWAVSIAQHHDAITGTAKQAVANDYHRLIAAGWEGAAAVVMSSLRRLLLREDEASRAEFGGGADADGGGGGGGDRDGAPGAAGPAPESVAASRRLLAPGAARPAAAAAGPASGAAAGAARAPAGLDLRQCLLANASSCPVTVTGGAPAGGWLVIVYNPLASRRLAAVKLPVPPLGPGDDGWEVQDSEGADAATQLVPVSAATRRLQAAMAAAGVGDDPPAFASQDLYFSADLPPLGYETYLVRPKPKPSAAQQPAAVQPATSQPAANQPAGGRRPAEPRPAVPRPAAAAAAAAAPAAGGAGARPRRGGEEGVLQSSRLRLEWDTQTGRLTALAARGGGWRVALAQDLMFYVPSRGDEGAGGGSPAAAAGSAPQCGAAGREAWRQRAPGGAARAAGAAGGGGEGGGEGGNGGQASGAYVFRPLGAARHILDPGTKVSVEVVRGELFEELRQCWAAWACLTTRLGRGDDQLTQDWTARRGDDHLEQDWTVGPIPKGDAQLGGREVILRTTTDLQTGGMLFTDANGREMQRRARDARPSWGLNVTEPIAGNYYPITAAAALIGAPPAPEAVGDARGARGRSFLVDSANGGGGGGGGREKLLAVTVATDRAQGAASLADGQVEVMLHRTTAVDDARGVGEPLEETMCGCRACACGGLVARGAFVLRAGPLRGAARAAREHQLRLNDPPVVAIARLDREVPAAAEVPAADAAASGAGAGGGAAASAAGGLAAALGAPRARVRGRWSGLAGRAPLPPGVHLATLMAAEEGDGARAIVRLAHIFQVGEDRALSRPARVDLSALFSRPVSNVAELSLTAARPRADVAPPRPWDVEPLSTTPRRGRTHIDTQPAAAAVWGDAAEDAEMGGEGAARPETYNVWEHPGDELPTVELYPMEIRTFELTFAD